MPANDRHGMVQFVPYRITVHQNHEKGKGGTGGGEGGGEKGGEREGDSPRGVDRSIEWLERCLEAWVH